MLLSLIGLYAAQVDLKHAMSSLAAIIKYLDVSVGVKSVHFKSTLSYLHVVAVR